MCCANCTPSVTYSSSEPSAPSRAVNFSPKINLDTLSGERDDRRPNVSWIGSLPLATENSLIDKKMLIQSFNEDGSVNDSRIRNSNEPKRRRAAMLSAA